MTIEAHPELVHCFDLNVKVSSPIEAGVVHGLNGNGLRRIIPIIGGTCTGKIEGEILSGGADFQLIEHSTTALLDAKYLIRLNSGEHIFVQNRAIRHANAAVTAALAQGQAVNPKDVYFGCSPVFEVSSPELYWLTENIFVGVGIRQPNHVKISMYQLTINYA